MLLVKIYFSVSNFILIFISNPAKLGSISDLLQSLRYSLAIIKKESVSKRHSEAITPINASRKFERFSIECNKTKNKSITYQLDCSANLKQ